MRFLVFGGVLNFISLKFLAEGKAQCKKQYILCMFCLSLAISGRTAEKRREKTTFPQKQASSAALFVHREQRQARGKRPRSFFLAAPAVSSATSSFRAA
jgi:hypothetical protein